MSCNPIETDDRIGYDPRIGYNDRIGHESSMKPNSIMGPNSVIGFSDNKDLGNSNFADLQYAYLNTPTMTEFKHKVMQNNGIYQNPNSNCSRCKVPDHRNGLDISEGNHPSISGPSDEGSEINSNLSNLLRKRSGNSNNIKESIPEAVNHSWNRNSQLGTPAEAMNHSWNRNSQLGTPAEAMSHSWNRNSQFGMGPESAMSGSSRMINSMPPPYHKKEKNISMCRMIIWIALIVAILYGIYYIYVSHREFYIPTASEMINSQDFIATLPK
jgi:hypothetical protein